MIAPECRRGGVVVLVFSLFLHFDKRSVSDYLTVLFEKPENSENTRTTSTLAEEDHPSSSSSIAVAFSDFGARLISARIWWASDRTHLGWLRTA